MADKDNILILAVAGLIGLVIIGILAVAVWFMFIKKKNNKPQYGQQPAPYAPAPQPSPYLPPPHAPYVPPTPPQLAPTTPMRPVPYEPPVIVTHPETPTTIAWFEHDEPSLTPWMQEQIDQGAQLAAVSMCDKYINGDVDGNCIGGPYSCYWDGGPPEYGRCKPRP